MADAVVSFLLDQLATVIQDEIQLVVGVEDEINKLTKTFKAIRVVLKDAEHKQFKDELVKLWLEEFKDVAYDMDDILDEWSTDMLIRSQIKGIENASNSIGKKKESKNRRRNAWRNASVLLHAQVDSLPL